jgi:hypothetical protein
MDYNDYSKPTLTEPGVKYFLSSTLKECHKIRMKFHNYIFNIGMFLLLVIVIAIILFCKYKGKISPSERYKKEKEKQEYILSKIQKSAYLLKLSKETKHSLSASRIGKSFEYSSILSASLCLELSKTIGIT